MTTAFSTSHERQIDKWNSPSLDICRGKFYFSKNLCRFLYIMLTRFVQIWALFSTIALARELGVHLFILPVILHITLHNVPVSHFSVQTHSFSSAAPLPTAAFQHIQQISSTPEGFWAFLIHLTAKHFLIYNTGTWIPLTLKGVVSIKATYPYNSCSGFRGFF